jgi:hypothetical protein
VFFTLSAISELRSAHTPTGHLGEGVTPLGDVKTWNLPTQVEESKLVPLPPANQDSTETESTRYLAGPMPRGGVSAGPVSGKSFAVYGERNIAPQRSESPHRSLFPFKYSEAALECLAGAWCVLSPSKSSRFDKRCQMKKRGAWQRMFHKPATTPRSAFF